MKTLTSLFLDTLADMYDAEKQIAKALPKLSAAAHSAELKEALNLHLEETVGHVLLVEEVFGCFDTKPRSKKCAATAGLLEEGASLAKDFHGSPALDAGIISAAQKVEHYEMASYGCLHTWASLLGNEEAADILTGILENEKEADAKLSAIALEQSNEEALEEVMEDTTLDGEEQKKSARKTLASKKAV